MAPDTGGARRRAADPVLRVAARSARPSIDWSAIFIVVNAYWIARLAVERRPVRLDADQERLGALSFPSLTRREARNLYLLGAWGDLPPGASLVEHDRARQCSPVIFRGAADVLYESQKVAELGPGQFVGEIDVRADAVAIDVVLRTDTRVMCWPRDRLRAPFCAGAPTWSWPSKGA
jgi:hypothetical protein